ncbi:hypothetical protein LXL04_028143 [Taraxacum kok-saghyz]
MWHKGETALATSEEQLREGDAILDELKFQLPRAQQMKQMEDTHQKEVQLTVRDKVTPFTYGSPTKLVVAKHHFSSSGTRCEVLIKWRSLSVEETTWEECTTIDYLFPFFHLEDKVTIWGRGISNPPLRFTYKRRGKML